MFRNVLVAYDGSPEAQRALLEGVDLADCANGRLTLLMALCRPSMWTTTSPETSVAARALDHQIQERAQAMLRLAAARVPSRVPVTTILAREPIRHALLERASADSHDLIIIGSRGRKAIFGAVLGSVSHDLLNTSPVPVLLVT